MEIINKGYPNSDQVMLESISCVYYQEPDCCSNDDGYQELTLSTRDGGGGKFFNLKTSEDGWSFCDIDDLISVIEDFKNRLNCNIKYENTDNSGCSRSRFLEDSDKE